MDDVAIVGVGLRPFGRFPGVSAIEMGAQAVRLALADAGVTWKDVQFAFGGSYEVDNPDAVVNFLGLTGLPFTDVYNGCATAASALTQAANTIRLGEYDLGVAVGMDKHLPGAFAADPVQYGVRQLVRRDGALPDPQVLRHEDPALHARLRDHTADAGQGGGQELPQRGAQSERLPAPGAERGGDPRLPAGERSADPVHVLLARRGRGRSRPVPGRRRVPLLVEAHLPAGVGRADAEARCIRGPQPLAPARPCRRPTVDASRAAYEVAGLGPEDVDVVQLQDTDAGAEVIHMAENGFCKDGEQEAMLAEGATEIGGSLPVNTDGGLIANGEPIGASGLRQIHELVLQLRGQAGDRQVPGTPRVGYGQLYGAPGTAGVAIVST